MSGRYIEFDLTYKCSAACAHCILNCHPRKGGLMSTEDALNYLVEAKKLGLTGADIVLTGGEPFLFYDRTLAIIRRAREVDMSPLGMIQTNGFWCKSDAETRQKLSELREAGLIQMYFSADPYHKQFVAVENVRRGVEISREIFGADNVSVGRQEFLDEPSALDIEAYARSRASSPPVMTGRAPWRLSQYANKTPLSEILEVNCEGGEQDLDPSTVKQINVDAYGWVSSWVCSGIVLGNAKKDPLSEILKRPLSEHNWIVGLLVENGPGALIEIAEEKGYKTQDAYVSKCHLCWEIRCFMLDDYPDIFMPRELYVDDA